MGFFPCKDHQYQTFYNENVGGKQNTDVYKGRLIACMYKHKFCAANTTCLDRICSIVFLDLSFLVKKLTQQRNSLILKGKIDHLTAFADAY